MKKTIPTLLRCSTLVVVMCGAICAQVGTSTSEVSNGSLTVSLRNKGATYEVRGKGLEKPVFSARVGAQVDRQWLWPTEYPQSHSRRYEDPEPANP
jgi:hypothetical protein